MTDAKVYRVRAVIPLCCEDDALGGIVDVEELT